MAVVGMVGVSFVGPREEVEGVALTLLHTENFEPMQPEVMMEGHPLGSRFQTFRGNRYAALLERFDRFWERGGLPIPQCRIVERAPSISLAELEAKMDDLTRAIDEWSAKAERLQGEYETWQAMLAFGETVRETGRNLSDLPLSLGERITLGVLTQENWRRLEETSLAASILAIPLIEGSGDRVSDPSNRITVVVFYGSDYREEAYKIFSSVHMHLVSVRPEDYGNYDNADAVRYRMEAIASEIQNYREMPGRYAEENRFELEKFYAAVYTGERIQSLCQLGGELSGMTVLAGWMPQSSYGDIAQATEEKAPHTLIMAEYGDILEREGNELPTLLHNFPLVRRFQEIVRLYSLPSYSELDPTFVVAVSFCLFFGFMFGDVGHGLALILGTLFLEKKKIMGRAIASVMKIAGASSVLFGFLYGSVFGSEELIHPLWLSPMTDVDQILPISIGVGIVFLTIGICFKIQNAARKEEWGEALFSPEGMAGLLFYWLAVAQAVAVTGNDPEIAFDKDIFIAIMASLFAVMIFGNGIAKYFFRGEVVDEGGVVHVFSVFHAMLSFVSNTASFVRLAAFALNHVGLSGAVFMLARMVENVPAGKLYYAVVLLLGHLVIIGLEGMIVFIQTLRLEYYEFFGKFYRGGGREFMPVLWKRRG
ncbi:MAG: ATPase [Synergistaceae bacterium]|jgi:V/A-type H+-transporting ATPase subunit I|nr:ATPase [Synergistaceae bacterium]